MPKRSFCPICNKMKRAGHSHTKAKPKTEMKIVEKGTNAKK